MELKLALFMVFVWFPAILFYAIVAYEQWKESIKPENQHVRKTLTAIAVISYGLALLVTAIGASVIFW